MYVANIMINCYNYWNSVVLANAHKPFLPAVGGSTFFNALPLLIAPNNPPLPSAIEGVGPKMTQSMEWS